MPSASQSRGSAHSLLADFVAHHTTDSRANAGAGQAATQHIASHAANDGASGSAFFLVGHTSATRQTQGCNQQHGRQTGAKTGIQFHGKFSRQTRMYPVMKATKAFTGESSLLAFVWAVSVRQRTLTSICHSA
jgi:hypothetical protein